MSLHANRKAFFPLTPTEVETAKRELSHAMADAAINSAWCDTEEEAQEEYDQMIDSHVEASELLSQLNSSQIEELMRQIVEQTNRWS